MTPVSAMTRHCSVYLGFGGKPAAVLSGEIPSGQPVGPIQPSSFSIEEESAVVILCKNSAVGVVRILAPVTPGGPLMALQDRHDSC